jgi:hypothetical protein
VLQADDRKLGPREQGWIRALFYRAYTAKITLAIDNGDSRSTVSSSRLLVDIMASVNATAPELKTAADLLRRVEQLYSKRSLSCQQFRDRVLMVFKAYYGDLPKKTLQKLIEKEQLT